MRPVRVLAVTLVALAAATPRPATAQTAADSAGIRRAALDYIEGWYAGDAARMERAVHPALVKRIVVRDAETGREIISEMGATQLVGGTARGGGRNTPPDKRRTDVRILDVFGSTAAVRVDADGWIDYMQLARWDGEWRIINVLWERR